MNASGAPTRAELRALLDTTPLRDRHRFARELDRLAATVPPDANALANWRTRVATAQARYAARADSVPAVSVDETLPIAARADEIVKLIRERQVIVLAGETGSGKSTQLPKLCLAAGRGVAGMIGCTQPRRVAARSIARRVAAELRTSVGTLVGFQVRFTEQVGERALVKFMTDGILLAETQGDPWLNAYDTIILDEAHERSLNIDFLLGYLKRLLARRHDLKLIVTSATIDTARFAAHFDNAPVVEVEGRSYPVEVRWRPAEHYATVRGGRMAGEVHADGRTAVPSPARSVGEGAPPLVPDEGRRRKRESLAGTGGGADGGNRPRADLSQTEHIVAAIDEITREDPRGDALVFLPGEREIRDAHLALTRRNYRATEVLPLYARLSANEQDRIFKPGTARRIVLATNVAETSLTVPRIRYVVDTGTARVKRYSPRNQLERLHVEPISKAAAEQRKGRCGRVGPGVCLRLYAEDDFAARAPYTDPEILRSSLAGVILRMLALKLGDVETFPFVEAPGPRAIGDGYRRLGELGAIDERRKLTEIGREMARLTIDVALARMLIEARRLGVARELLVLTAFLGIQDPRERPADARAAADAAHAPFADPSSDFISILNLWQAHALAHEELTQSKLRDWCSERFLSYLRMREWRELHRQLLVIGDPGSGTGDWEPADRGSAMVTRSSTRRASKQGTHVPLPNEAASSAATNASSARLTTSSPASPVPSPQAYESIHRSLLSGWPTQVGRKDERSEYRGTRERKFQIFPGSTLAKRAPNWLLAGQILDIKKVYALQCARVEPEWIEQQAVHLVKRSWREPHWSRKRGAVMAYEQVTLLGLTLVEKRAVLFGKQDPLAAHAVFVREALARGDIDSRADVVRANARVLAQAHEIEAKRRRSGLVRDEEELARFFAGKLPAEISTTAAFDAWYRRASAVEQAALHWSLDDVLTAEPGLRASDFPTHLDCAGHKLRLEFRFVPGDDADGVTLHVPLAFVNAVPPARCEWIVPGLLPDKVAELIRGLPKSLRRNFVPAPDFARAFAEAQMPRDESLVEALAAYLERVTGVAIAGADFAGIEVPPHLRMRFRVHDERGRTLAEGRDIGAIREQWGGAANAAFSRQADAELTREDVAEFDFDEIPERVTSASGLAAFPALVDLGESVALRVFERRDEALAAHAHGVERLLRRALRDVIKQARRQMPIDRRLALRYAAIASVDALREDIVEAALRECFAASDLQARTRNAFRDLQADMTRRLFPTAVEWLAVVEDVLSAYADLTPWLEPPLMGFARANYDDLHEQLGALVHPGFVCDVPRARLAHYPRYLKAMRLRAERLRQDPTRDQARMLTVRGYWSEYLKLKAQRNVEDSALDELRWLIEELRVSLFAQELKTAEPVSPKRLGATIARLRE
jgi:ATP-dependent helicase HrpA